MRWSHPAPCKMVDCSEDRGRAIGNRHLAANILKRLLTRQAELGFVRGIGRVGPFSDLNLSLPWGCRASRHVLTCELCRESTDDALRPEGNPADLPPIPNRGSGTHKSAAYT